MKLGSINDSIAESTFPEFIKSTILLEKRKETHENFISWQRYESLCGMFAFFSLIALISDYEKSYDTSSDRSSCNLSNSTNGNTRILTVVISFATIYLLVCRYITESKWLEMTFYTTGKSLNYVQRRHKIHRRVQLVFEILILMVMPIPFYDVEIKIPQYFGGSTFLMCYRLNTLMLCFSTGRIYFCIRALINYSVFHNEQALIFCIRNNINTGLGFAIKCLVKTHPYKIIGLLALVTTLIGSFFARIFERPIDIHENVFYDYIPNYIWFMIESISTLGYGEYYCLTYSCRLVVCMTWFFGSIFVGLLIGAAQQTTELSKNEGKAFSLIRNTHSSVKMLKAWVRYIETKKRTKDFNRINKAKNNLDAAAKQCKKSRLFAKRQCRKPDKELGKEIIRIRAEIAISSMKLDNLIKLYEEPKDTDAPLN